MLADSAVLISPLLIFQCGGSGLFIPNPDTDFLPSRIPDPGVKKAPNPGSRIRIRNTVIFYAQTEKFLNSVIYSRMLYILKWF